MSRTVTAEIDRFKDHDYQSWRIWFRVGVQIPWRFSLSSSLWSTGTKKKYTALNWSAFAKRLPETHGKWNGTIHIKAVENGAKIICVNLCKLTFTLVISFALSEIWRELMWITCMSSAFFTLDNAVYSNLPVNSGELWTTSFSSFNPCALWTVEALYSLSGIWVHDLWN